MNGSKPKEATAATTRTATPAAGRSCGSRPRPRPGPCGRCGGRSPAPWMALPGTRSGWGREDGKTHLPRQLPSPSHMKNQLGSFPTSQLHATHGTRAHSASVFRWAEAGRAPPACAWRSSRRSELCAGPVRGQPAPWPPAPWRAPRRTGSWQPGRGRGMSILVTQRSHRHHTQDMQRSARGHPEAGNTAG